MMWSERFTWFYGSNLATAFVVMIRTSARVAFFGSNSLSCGEKGILRALYDENLDGVVFSPYQGSKAILMGSGRDVSSSINSILFVPCRSNGPYQKKFSIPIHHHCSQYKQGGKHFYQGDIHILG